MEIKPSINKSAPFYPTLIAAVGAMLTGCDKQTAPGIVPFEQKPTPSENQQQIPGAEGCKPPVSPEVAKKLQTPPGAVEVQPSGMWGELLKLGGESIETPEIKDPFETPELRDGDSPHMTDATNE